MASSESAIYGLVGVVVGAVVTTTKDWWFQYRKTQKDVEYLAIQVSCSLDKFAAECAAVAMDEGLQDEQQYRHTSVDTPRFETKDFSVEWKSLPATLMYEVLGFPYSIEVAKGLVADTLEHVAMPPDFEEFFEERQLQYATIGLQAAALAAKLRKHAKLPPRAVSEWNPVAQMEEQKVRIEAFRHKREREYVSSL